MAAATLEAGPVLVVGLGNPGDKYRWNRHNVGFLFLDHLAASLGPGGWAGREKFGGELMDVRLAGRRAYLFKPLSYMNLSGSPTARVAGFFQVPPEAVFVCFDDVALPFGSLRLRASGSAGGQKGMLDVIRALGTDAIPRLRYGIGAAHPVKDLAGFVLDDFSKVERGELPALFERGAKALETALAMGIEAAASRFNLTAKREVTG